MPAHAGNAAVWAPPTYTHLYPGKSSIRPFAITLNLNLYIWRRHPILSFLKSKKICYILLFIILFWGEGGGVGGVEKMQIICTITKKLSPTCPATNM